MYKLQLWVFSAMSALALASCGGSGKSPTAAPNSTATVVVTGKLAGQVFAADSGNVLANVQVLAGARTTTTANDGSFTQEGVTTGDSVMLRFSRAGYADGFATSRVTAGDNGRISVRMSPVAVATTFDNKVGATLTNTATPARVVLSAGSVVNSETGAVSQGPLTVEMAVINPATNPSNMPGNYTTNRAERIESFGAISVQIRDSAGTRLNLAPGSTAAIRIPVASRSSNPPGSIPLYFFDETTGLWVEQGSAKLAGNASDQYYEGTVSHLSYWNADQQMDTVFVNGCVVDTSGKPSGPRLLRADGIDYSGNARVISDLDGKFKIAIRRNSQALIEVFEKGATKAVVVGPSNSDLLVGSCLVFDPAGVQALPVIALPSTTLSATEGKRATFFVITSDAFDYSYQWQRNGQPIAGATNRFYSIKAAQLADDKAQFSVKVTNKNGSVTSQTVTLTVTMGVTPPPGNVPPPGTLSPTEVDSLLRMTFLAANVYAMGFSPVDQFITDATLWADPAKVCKSGTAKGTLNSFPIPVGSMVVAGSGTLSGTFAQCVPVSDDSALYDGTAQISYTTTAGLTNFTGDAQISNFHIVQKTLATISTDLTGNGTIGVVGTSNRTTSRVDESLTITPRPGTILVDNKTGQNATFVSGSTIFTSVTPVNTSALFQASTNQQNLTFTLGGSMYVASGLLTTNTANSGSFTGSGQIILTRDGIRLGRIFATSQGLFVEINGVIQPFATGFARQAKVVGATAG